ncbi:uncharacterized protein K452DRAFT_66150 [Aplosporella prunicola CBS 121167]|uniref:Uncharacterized protein n=1 Tax=Aplosporella prunicola CBS 121167 TaxID=1176127 RepID=A0A6A6BQW4_9PEZI|nr:uncharacterized protein K452DRAFT_66150 [Aplosporella prunicola CBS 121167]KAF2146476.1 hypothetical protein K452DRAFT_66150 [Aplosporella prunicola CBS 121167]
MQVTTLELVLPATAASSRSSPKLPCRSEVACIAKVGALLFQTQTINNSPSSLPPESLVSPAHVDAVNERKKPRQKRKRPVASRSPTDTLVPPHSVVDTDAATRPLPAHRDRQPARRQTLNPRASCCRCRHHVDPFTDAAPHQSPSLAGQLLPQHRLLARPVRLPAHRLRAQSQPSRPDRFIARAIRRRPAL